MNPLTPSPNFQPAPSPDTLGVIPPQAPASDVLPASNTNAGREAIAPVDAANATPPAPSNVPDVMPLTIPVNATPAPIPSPGAGENPYAAPPKPNADGTWPTAKIDAPTASTLVGAPATGPQAPAAPPKLEEIPPPAPSKPAVVPVAESTPASVAAPAALDAAMPVAPNDPYANRYPEVAEEDWQKAAASKDKAPTPQADTGNNLAELAPEALQAEADSPEGKALIEALAGDPSTAFTMASEISKNPDPVQRAKGLRSIAPVIQKILGSIPPR